MWLIRILREQYYHLAMYVLVDLPDCRECSLALTYLEDSCMQAMQALAMQGTPIPIGQYHDGNSAKLE